MDGAIKALGLEDVARVRGALDAGLPRDEVFAAAGVSAETFAAAEERCLARLAVEAAGGRIDGAQRFASLVGAAKVEAEEAHAEARRRRRKERVAKWSAPAPAPAVMPPAAVVEVPPAVVPPPVAPPPVAPPPAFAEPAPVAPPAGRPRAPARTLVDVSPAPAPALPFAPTLAAPAALPFAPPPPAAAPTLAAPEEAPPSAKKKIDLKGTDPVALADALRKALPFVAARANAAKIAAAGPPSSPTPPAPSKKAGATLGFTIPPEEVAPALPFTKKEGALPIARAPGPVVRVTPPPFAAMPGHGPSHAPMAYAGTQQAFVAAPAAPAPTAPSAAAPASIAPPVSTTAARERAQAIGFALYIQLCAEARKGPAGLQKLRQAHGLDDEAWTALHRLWRERFDADPRLRERWQTAVEQLLRGPA